ncbi:uncharacterized protein GLRG_00672 [Colletotrichum graminicola M1.001]|uniref:Uncharacterized protein n=1 Tax=Colletotrichum graminicola (strain M1.001 / M2 / FGSC 10212) TaxID=645133 RepID=E3Q3C6_COLGM|nr:uncharacterized protein GLRG_00672 [Colletotrichum graminicola M1.001]EFQ25528.1 hypothetical protein GLRG_00672 [Colletotrichum graminicola M1.001]
MARLRDTGACIMELDVAALETKVRVEINNAAPSPIPGEAETRSNKQPQERRQDPSRHVETLAPGLKVLIAKPG